MAKYLDKWKDLFPDTVGGTTRPSEAVSDQEEFNTDGFPQFIAQDPVNYALQNAFLKQFLSNDAWLWVKQKQANQALDDHKVDTQAHAKGISGNAGSATKLANARTINLSGAVTADAVSFDGTADATINVKTLDASKLKGTASVSTTGNAATATKVVTTAAPGASANIAEASMGGSDNARIRVSGAENAGELALETADDGDEAIVARQYTGAYAKVARTASILDKNGNTSFPGTVVAPNFTGSLNGNAATATKLQTPRTLSLTGKAAGSATFDGSSNAAINVTSVNADTASKLSTARKINITGNATGSATFDGTSDVSINVSVSQAAHADKANESTHAAAATALDIYAYRPADANIQKGDGLVRYFLATRNMKTNKPMEDAQILHLAWDAPGWDAQLAITNSDGDIQTRAQDTGTWGAWKTFLNEKNYNNYAPTKTGGGASGTWGINISGNADTVDGYHASDLLRTLGGNRTPVITDIFDRAGTIDMSTMSAADKATHKANINKASNMTQNLWNTGSGMRAYGGDTDMNGYNHGTLKLTQSYKNFDKILVVSSNDDGNYACYNMWDVWELANAFANNYRFNLLGQCNIYWSLYGTAKHGTTTNYAVSTDTVWSCQEQNCGIIAIYGIKF